MKDADYWNKVDTVISCLPEATATAFRNGIVRHWREGVAPQKHRDYGIECWERLGPKALVADLSAVFYRYKNMYVQNGRVSREMSDIIIDAFGYAVIYTVCLYEQWSWTDPPFLSDILALEMFGKVERDEPVGHTNERLIRVGWDGYEVGHPEGIAMRQAYNMWRGVTP